MFGLTSKTLCYVKGEGTNMGNMTMALKLIMLCEALSLHIPFDGACFTHAMSKTIQSATYDDKISKDLSLVNVKST